MKRKISKEEFDKLSDVKKEDYKEKNGSYFLDIEDDDEAIVSLTQAKENEKNRRKELQKELDTLKEQIQEITNEKNRKTGDVEALENSWKERLTKRETELTSELNKLRSSVINTSRDNLLTQLASKLAKSDSHRLFKKGIEDRIHSEFDGEKVVHRILDKEGKPSALGIEDFEKEILANKEFSSILVASKASGAGGSDTKKLGAGSPPNAEKPPLLANMKPSEIAAGITARKQAQQE